MTNTVDIRQATKLELLEEKLSLLLKIKDLTAASDISGNDAEERYITLISRREAIIKQIRALDTRLAVYASEIGEHKLLGLIRETSERILEMDSEMSRHVPGMMQGIKKRIKQVKDGRVINRAYHTEMYGIVAGSSFNHKQ